jgi:HPt (histidine-containing phosphotransfer) domain-containing protein
VSDGPINRETFDGLLEMTGGDLAFVDELVDTYLEDGRDQIAALEAAAAGSDVTALVRPAHSLKTSSLNVGAMELGGLCQDLEQRARTGGVDDATARVASIAEGFALVSKALLAERAARG